MCICNICELLGCANEKTYDSILFVTPPIHYIVFAIPHKKEIPSQKGQL